MSRVTRKEWYRRVNATWPAERPALTAVEAERAAKKLWRSEMGRALPWPVKIATGNRHTWVRSGHLNINLAGYYGRDGWQTLVHSISHLIDNRTNHDTAPHHGNHARIEIRLIKVVISRGWLQGALKDKPKPVKVEPDARVEKYRRILARIDSWERKKRRAENALKKLQRQARYYEKALPAGGSVMVH